ncbi:MAG: hypothetical protein H0W40_11350 [Methylibium sp.]|uniref:primase-helicase family protein n=1 Tax=Methylibium sp. TaxID=2067992 RepID=UPI00180C5AE8|nr:DUF5906 domain-containing protein [Methylibium sp.]MBA3597953.1 hypothetical protein [Methylibium sp.]
MIIADDGLHGGTHAPVIEGLEVTNAEFMNAVAGGVGDRLTVLRHPHNLLAKTWRADGTIKQYDEAKYFTHNEVSVRSLAELSALLTKLQTDPRRCIIRGRYVGDEVAAIRDSERQAGKVRRALDYFDDQPLHAVLFDVDKFTPLMSPDPLDGISEFIQTMLPAAFHTAGYHWQLSNSAGHATKHDGELRVHLWFWLSTPRLSAELKAWAKAAGVKVDLAVFHPVQVHYTAGPVMEPGVVDPIAQRCGLVTSDAVELEIDPAVLAQAERPAAGRGQRLREVAAEDPIAQRLAELGLIKGPVRDGFNIECPFENVHTPGSGGESSTQYFLPNTGGRTLGNFKCLHDSCGARRRGEFLARLGIDEVVDAFDIVELDEQQAAESAAAAIQNAKRPPARPAVVLETDIERAKRIEREKSKAIGSDGERAPLPTQRLWTGSEMLEELVLLEEGTRVSRVSDPRYVLPFEEFKKSSAGSVETTKNAAGRPTKVHRAQLWLESPDRKTVRTQTFAPGREGLCRSPDNVPAQNLWVPRRHAAPANWRELSAPFFGHVEYLVPALAERERFLDWLAHIEQEPGDLPSTHYLLVAQQTGIGRNWLAYALARAFAGHTALGFDLSAALKSGFNGSLSMKLLAVVDELHEGGPGGAHTPAAEKLKSMLTEATRLINPKHGRQHVEFNCARFLMFSNHAAALPLADNDRRVIVIENPSERRSEEYFIELYALLDDPTFGAALVEAFRQRNISLFNPGAPAPMTEAKARTIRAGRTEIEQAVRDVATEWPSACITSCRLTRAVSDALGGRTWNTQSACVAAGLVKYAGRHRVAGVQSHIWVLRDHAAWRSAEPAAVVHETERGQVAAGGEDFA